MSQTHSSVAPQIFEVKAPRCCHSNRVILQHCSFLRTIQVHIFQAMYIDRVGQGPQPASFHSHPRVHHFEKLSNVHQQSSTNRTADNFFGTSVALRLSRFYSYPTQVTWVLRGSPKGWGEGGTLTPPLPQRMMGTPGIGPPPSIT